MHLPYLEKPSDSLLSRFLHSVLHPVSIEIRGSPPTHSQCWVIQSPVRHLFRLVRGSNWTLIWQEHLLAFTDSQSHKFAMTQHCTKTGYRFDKVQASVLHVSETGTPPWPLGGNQDNYMTALSKSSPVNYTHSNYLFQSSWMFNHSNSPLPPHTGPN